MNIEDRVLYYIASVRKRLGDNCSHYLNGGCYSFYFKLLGKFPEAECWYDGDHVITKIKDKFYDITGEVKKDRHLAVNGHHYSHIQMKNWFK